jgi:hypothetical protein
MSWSDMLVLCSKPLLLKCLWWYVQYLHSCRRSIRPMLSNTIYLMLVPLRSCFNYWHEYCSRLFVRSDATANRFTRVHSCFAKFTSMSPNVLRLRWVSFPVHIGCPYLFRKPFHQWGWGCTWKWFHGTPAMYTWLKQSEPLKPAHTCRICI